jgi:hypothetical protein
MSHLIYRFMHSLNDCRSQWLCNITDSQTDNVLVRICLLMARNSFTEEEAHKYIQKRSMDNGTGLVEVAQMILSLLQEG